MSPKTSEPEPIILDSFVAQIFTAQITASQNAANQVIENLEAERDRAEQMFLDFYDAVLRGSESSPVTIRKIDEALLRFGHRADGIERSREIRSEWAARREASDG